MKHHLPQLGECRATRAKGEVSTPPEDDRVKNRYQRLLGRGSVNREDFSKPLLMSFYCCGTGLNDGLKAEQPPCGVSTRPVFPYRMLSNMKPQEVKTRCPLTPLQGVGDTGLAWL